MKLIQYHLPDQGKRVGIVTREEEIVDVTTEESSTVLDLLKLSIEEGVSLGVILADIQEQVSFRDLPSIESRVLASSRGSSVDGIGGGRGINAEGAPINENGKLKLLHLDNPPDPNLPHILPPIDAPEVWAFGVTYKRSADMRDDDSASDIYSKVYFSDRPELFFKATANRCVGSGGSIAIRSDSTFTATEPELAYILGRDGEIIGYTICNDVSAWDIERENPLYLPQSKIYTGCCALGPMLVTVSEVDDPYNLDIKCRVIRDDKLIFRGEVNTSQINWKFEQLTECLIRHNPVPIGTVVSTGTGIITPADLPLIAGDIVQIEINGFGTLSNPVIQL